MRTKIFVILALMSMSFAGVSAKDILSVGNDGFSSEIVVDGGRILPASLSFGGKTVTSAETVPYFEFCVNSCTVTSLSPIWRYVGKDSGTLSNGGGVTTFHLAAKGKFKGLHVLVDRECFPDAAFVRERMRLYSTRPGLRLTNVEGKNHFIFPQYSFSAEKGLSAEQLRIGRFQTKTNLTDNHTFHPDRFPVSVTEHGEDVKGPFVIIRNGDCRILTSYEHASQDNTFMNEKNVKHSGGNDEMQGVEGDQGFITDDDLWFIATRLQRTPDGGLTVSNRIRRGGYCDRESIPQEGYYETVWSTVSLLGREDSLDESLQRYLYDRISDHAASRKPVFYYNTWGMQRDQPKEHLKDCITEERLLKDIEYCKEMGIERFILDDGWQSAMGFWTANRRLYPNGLGPVIKKIQEAGMEPGVWLSLLALAKG
ncbi:MAG: alpha-galactosidase, partial [Bacteroidales bacterium]|nr:alpha-galactosidase [Bacteroidales bacterium]